MELLTAILQMLRACDMRAAGYPHLVHDAIFVARAAMKAMVTFHRCVYIGYRGLAYAAGKDDLC